VYEWSTSGLFGPCSFLGVSSGLFDTPFFESPNVVNETVAGRIQGEYFCNKRNACTGQWAFHFFDEDDWITARYGFRSGDDEPEVLPNTVTGGAGRWASFVGTLDASTVTTDAEDTLVIEWTICRQEPEATLEAGECAMVWELSTNGTFFTTDGESIEFGTNQVFLPR
jgi:hypothetical protein